MRRAQGATGAGLFFWRRMVSRRATSLRSERSSWVFSTWPVCLRRRVWRRDSRISRILVVISTWVRSLISLDVMVWRPRVCASDDGALADDEPAVEGKLGVRKAERLLGDAGGNAGELEKDGAGLDDRHVELDRALALAHADLGGLLG